MNTISPPAIIKTTNRFRSRSSLTSAGAFAAAATVAAPSLASASIIWSGVLDQQVTLSSPTALLDLFGEGAFEPGVARLFIDEDKGDNLLYFVQPIGFDYWGRTSLPLDFGTPVDSSLFFSTGGNINPTDPVYYGFRSMGLTGDDEFYGWVQVSFASNTSFGTLHQWAYNSTSGAPITVGAIPEPAHAALLMAGVVLAFLAKRRRRRSA